MVFVGASTCGGSTYPALPGAVRQIRRALALDAARSSEQFVSIGVALDGSLANGLQFLGESGPYNEVAVGGGWMNMATFSTGYPANESAMRAAVGRVLGAERAERFFDRLLDNFFSDADAGWETVIELDASALEPMVALPGDPGNGVFLGELGGPVKIDIAYAGSCTAGKKSDMDMYAAVFRDALEQGKHVHPDVKCYVQCGSQEVKRYCEDMGYLEVFERAGAVFIEPSCGACINAGPGVSYDRGTVTISAINRNFPGRSGPGQLYLASPYTTAASAIAGHIAAWEPKLVSV